MEPSPSSVAPAQTATSVASVPSPAVPSASAPALPCGPDMVEAPLACIDRFEAPNEPGKRPLLMVTATEAEAWCVDHGKRLCTEREWMTACGGASVRLRRKALGGGGDDAWA